MKKVVLVGSQDTSSLFQMLKALKEIVKADWVINMLADNVIEVHHNPLKDILEKYLVMDIDQHTPVDLADFEGYTVITVGFNKKASVTVSSVEDDEIVFCIQREIEMVEGTIEPQEFVIKGGFFSTGDILNNIFSFTALLLINEKEIKNYF